jgi:hypothetical protein
MSHEGSTQELDAEAPITPALLPRFQDAFERVLPELLAVPASEVGEINLEVEAVVSKVLALLPRIRELRADVVKIVHPDYSLARYDRIEDYTLALGHAHAVYLVSSEPPVPPEALAEEGLEVRKILAKDAAPLVKRNLLSPERLAKIGSRSGFRNIAFDLLEYVALFRDHWSAVRGRTRVTVAKLQNVEMLAEELLTAAATREAAKQSKESTADKRNRAFRVFIEAYEDVRRVVGFARWKEKDADQIAPSLHGETAQGSNEGAGAANVPEPNFPEPMAPEPEDRQ